MDLFVKIIAIIVAMVGYITSFVICFFFARTRNWSKVGLGIILTGLFFGIGTVGLLLAIGVNGINQLFLWGIASGIFGIFGFVLLLITHGLIIPSVLTYISKKVAEDKHQ